MLNLLVISILGCVLAARQTATLPITKPFWMLVKKLAKPIPRLMENPVDHSSPKQGGTGFPMNFDTPVVTVMRAAALKAL